MQGEPSTNSRPARPSFTRRIVDHRHAQRSTRARARQPIRPKRRGSCASAAVEERDAVVRRPRRRPGADVVDPGRRPCPGAPISGTTAIGAPVARQHDEPRPRRAFPELRVEAADVADVGRRGQHETIHPLLAHQALGASCAVVLGRREAARWRHEFSHTVSRRSACAMQCTPPPPIVNMVMSGS